MATDFSGTNTERVDKLVAAVIELRTTTRLILAAIGYGGPVVAGLLSFLVLQAFKTEARLERIDERTVFIQQELKQQGDRFGQLQQEVKQQGERLIKVEQKVEAMDERLTRVEKKLDLLIERLTPPGGKP